MSCVDATVTDIDPCNPSFKTFSFFSSTRIFLPMPLHKKKARMAAAAHGGIGFVKQPDPHKTVDQGGGAV